MRQGGGFDSCRVSGLASRFNGGGNKGRADGLAFRIIGGHP